MDTLIPPLEASAEAPAVETPVADTVKSDDSTETHYKMLMEQELKIQREEEKYTIYIGMLSEEERKAIQTPTLMKVRTNILIKKNECILERNERTLKIINFTFSGMLLFAVCSLVEVIVLNLNMYIIVYIYIHTHIYINFYSNKQTSLL